MVTSTIISNQEWEKVRYTPVMCNCGEESKSKNGFCEFCGSCTNVIDRLNVEKNLTLQNILNKLVERLGFNPI